MNTITPLNFPVGHKTSECTYIAKRKLTVLNDLHFHTHKDGTQTLQIELKNDSLHFTLERAHEVIAYLESNRSDKLRGIHMINAKFDEVAWNHLLEKLKKCDWFSRLNLDGCQLTKKQIDSLAPFKTKLTHLKFNRLGELGDDVFEAMTQFLNENPVLCEFHLKDSKLSFWSHNHMATGLKTCNNLQTLKLDKSSFSGFSHKISGAINDLANLKILSLRGLEQNLELKLKPHTILVLAGNERHNLRCHAGTDVLQIRPFKMSSVQQARNKITVTHTSKSLTPNDYVDFMKRYESLNKNEEGERPESESFLTMIMQHLQLRLGSAPGDGNCLFHSISNLLKLEGSKQYDYHLLRQEVSNHLRCKPELSAFLQPDDVLVALGYVGSWEELEGNETTQSLITNFQLMDEIRNENEANLWNDYCNKVAENGSWSGIIELMALADVLRRQIIVMDCTCANNYEIKDGRLNIPNHFCFGSEYTQQVPLYVHRSHNHFSPLYPIL